MTEDLTRQLATERERADYAWRNTRTIEAARQEEMHKRDAAEAALAEPEGFWLCDKFYGPDGKRLPSNA